MDCSRTIFETIQLIQLGFDDDDRPVCIVLDSSEQWEHGNIPITASQISVDDLKSMDPTVYDRVEWTMFNHLFSNRPAPAPILHQIHTEQKYTGYLAIKVLTIEEVGGVTLYSM